MLSRDEFMQKLRAMNPQELEATIATVRTMLAAQKAVDDTLPETSVQLPHVQEPAVDFEAARDEFLHRLNALNQ